MRSQKDFPLLPAVLWPYLFQHTPRNHNSTCLRKPKGLYSICLASFNLSRSFLTRRPGWLELGQSHFLPLNDSSFVFQFTLVDTFCKTQLTNAYDHCFALFFLCWLITCSEAKMKLIHLTSSCKLFPWMMCASQKWLVSIISGFHHMLWLTCSNLNSRLQWIDIDITYLQFNFKFNYYSKIWWKSVGDYMISAHVQESSNLLNFHVKYVAKLIIFI